MGGGWKHTIEGDILSYIQSKEHPVTYQDVVDKILPKYSKHVTRGVISSYLIRLKNKGLVESELLEDHVRIYWYVGE